MVQEVQRRGLGPQFQRSATVRLVQNLLGRLINERFTPMGKHDPRVDAYIAKSADFAKPILTHIRKVVHAACPDVEETMKWSAPHFDYKGEMMCGMAAFKAHCAFGFWKSSLVLDGPAVDAMRWDSSVASRRSAICRRIERLTGYIKKAAKLNDDGDQGCEETGDDEEAGAHPCRLCVSPQEEAGRAEGLRRLQPKPPS